MKRCPNCNQSLSVSTKYCANCGAKIEVTASSQEEISPEGIKQARELSSTDKVKVTAQNISNILKVVAGIFALVLVYKAYGTFHGSSSPAPAQSSLNHIYMTQDAFDGQFKFQVTAGPKCGMRKVGDEFNGETAKGQFCSIRVWVTNKSNKPGDFFDSNQKMYDSNGNEYDVSGAADLSANGALSYDSINPGLSVLGDIYFDIPTSSVPSYVVLHDSVFSTGVTIMLKDDPAVVAAASAATLAKSYILINSNFETTDKFFYPIQKSEYGSSNCSATDAWCVNYKIIPRIHCPIGVQIVEDVILGSKVIEEFKDTFKGDITAGQEQGLISEDSVSNFKQYGGLSSTTDPMGLKFSLKDAQCLTK